MTTCIYDMSIGSYLQSLDSTIGILEKGATYCAKQDIDLADVVETRLFADMLPFRFQITSVVLHTLGAAKSIQNGLFSPTGSAQEYTYTQLQTLVLDARNELAAIPSEVMDARAGEQVMFKFGEREIPFTAENFILSFSLPNVHFHAATAYDILRTKGVPLGKRDFLGPMRMGV